MIRGLPIVWGDVLPGYFLTARREFLTTLSTNAAPSHVSRFPVGAGEYVITLQDGTTLTSSRTYSDRLRALLEQG